MYNTSKIFQVRRGFHGGHACWADLRPCGVHTLFATDLLSFLHLPIHIVPSLRPIFSLPLTLPSMPLSHLQRWPPSSLAPLPAPSLQTLSRHLPEMHSSPPNTRKAHPSDSFLIIMLCMVSRIVISCFFTLPVEDHPFHGVSLADAKGSLPLQEMRKSGDRGFQNGQRGLQVMARTAGTSRTIDVEVDKPLGLSLGQKSGGGVVITAVDGGGNAARAGLKAGNQVLSTSSFFGDELWPADKLGFTKTAVQAKSDSVYFAVSRGADVDVKRLGKRPAPPKFGRKLTEAQKTS